jgi:hypothetical protein
MAITHNTSNFESAELKSPAIACRFIANLAQMIANIILARAMQALFRFERRGRLLEGS